MDLIATFEKQLANVKSKSPLQVLRDPSRDKESRDLVNMFLYTADGGPDGGGYKRTMSVPAVCVKHKVCELRNPFPTSERNARGSFFRIRCLIFQISTTACGWLVFA
jgi:hypothetical protein